MSDNRSHIEEKYQWDLTTVFASDQAWEAEMVALSADVEAARRYAGHLIESSQNLLEITELEPASQQPIDQTLPWTEP